MLFAECVDVVVELVAFAVAEPLRSGVRARRAMPLRLARLARAASQRSRGCSWPAGVPALTLPPGAQVVLRLAMGPLIACLFRAVKKRLPEGVNGA